MLQSKQISRVVWTLAPLGRVAFGRLVHENLQLAPDVNIEVWDKESTCWIGMYSAKLVFFVNKEMKGIWCRVIGCDEVGTDFWQEMKRIQTGAPTVDVEWIADREDEEYGESMIGYPDMVGWKGKGKSRK